MLRPLRINVLVPGWEMGRGKKKLSAWGAREGTKRESEDGWMEERWVVQ